MQTSYIHHSQNIHKPYTNHTQPYANHTQPSINRYTNHSTIVQEQHTHNNFVKRQKNQQSKKHHTTTINKLQNIIYKSYKTIQTHNTNFIQQS